MLCNNIFFDVDSAIEAHKMMLANRDPHAYVDAVHLFERVCQNVKLEKTWNWLRGHRPAGLIDLDQVKGKIKVASIHYCGFREVPLSQIRGSQGRICDFDEKFRPVSERTKERWLSIASAWYLGMGLPPVELIKIGNYYFVQDGNHRVSVARAMGKFSIDAEVDEWQVIGSLPWEAETCGLVAEARAAVM
jgi:hypothetical protein